MLEKIRDLRKEFESHLKAANTAADLEMLRVQFLGKKSPIQDLMKFLRDVPEQERPATGKVINDLKEYVAQTITTTQEKLIEQEAIQIDHVSGEITVTSTNPS